MPSIIMHVDMDAFFASCEEARNPELRGKAVVIGSDPKQGKGRGVVSTCNYEARKYGIRSATPISKAFYLNPQATFLRGDFELYSNVSRRIMAILSSYTRKIQKVSVDEAYLEVSDKVESFEEAREYAHKIKQAIFEQENITCSIGIGNNKLVAKIASDENKPNGITLVENNTQFLWPLPIRKLYGVGPKTEQKLVKLGITTIGKLAYYNKEALFHIFGVYGYYLNRAANGHGSTAVEHDYSRVSLGKERTFFQDVDDEAIIKEKLQNLCEQVGESIGKESFAFRTVSLKVRYHNYTTYMRSKTPGYMLTTGKAIYQTAKELYREFEGNKIRLIGVRVSHLEDWSGQESLLSYCA